MTRDEILKMPAGRELDRIVAEKVMKYRQLPVNWFPSTDLCAAWDVAEEIGITVGPSASEEKGRYFAVISKIGTDEEYWWYSNPVLSDGLHAYAETAPLAICYAALILCRGEKPADLCKKCGLPLVTGIGCVDHGFDN